MLPSINMPVRFVLDNHRDPVLPYKIEDNEGNACDVTLTTVKQGVTMHCR